MNRFRKIGVHTSIAGGLPMSLERAHELGCNTMQIFSHNPRGWAMKRKGPDEIEAFVKSRKKYDISPVYIHTSYLINLASANETLSAKSLDMVLQEMDIADSIGAEYVVLHTGSASGEDAGIARKRAIACLTAVAKRGEWKAGLLLENTAGERGDITSRVEEIAEIMAQVPGKLISGICIDTCHAFSAGYDIGKDEGLQLLLDEILKYIGKEKIRLLHLNDAKGGLGRGLDRHEHIGHGAIGIGGFKNFLNHHLFSNIPMILETPKKSPDDDVKNLATVRKLIAH
ncbi:MAG: deoxyribonuclease IV [Nitrospirota bacterium]|nr:deoxyribonuclease IV [Nitrospirota bacterium]